MKTIEFKATIGVAEGYGHNNDGITAADEVVAAAWQEAAANVFRETGLYISAVVSPSRTVYHTNWGCPQGGELTATVTGTANPAFVSDIEEWKGAVVEVVKAVKATLKQSTVAVEFSEVEDFIYLAD